MIGKILITGHIGDSYVDQAGMYHKGTNLLNVIEQAESTPNASEYEVEVNSPGGYVDVGDAIYSYLTSLKTKGAKITTIQTGLVGSIATKIFLAGDERIADDRYKFWIHNPYKENVSGDQDELMAQAKSLEETEKALRKFYSEMTGITDEGLDGLMKIETGLTADQCVKFRFATAKKQIPILNIIKPMNTKNEKSKAEIPAQQEQKNLVVNLAEGAGSFYVEGDTIAEGAPAFLLDEAGEPTAEPLADGDYLLEDGTMVSVSGGIISAVVPAESEPMEEEASVETFTQEQVNEIVKAEVEKAISALKAESTQALAKVNEEILAIKKNTRIGVVPKAGFYQAQGDKNEYKTIAERNKEKAELRKKQLNSK